jgi:hypothetical protein
LPLSVISAQFGRMQYVQSIRRSWSILPPCSYRRVFQADYVLNLINGSQSQESTEPDSADADAATVLAQKLESSFKSSSAAKLLQPMDSPPALSTDKQENRPGFFRHVLNICKRQLFNLWREPALLRAGLGQCIFVALLLGLTFLRQTNTQTALNNRAGAVFFGCAYMMFAGLLIPFQICTSAPHMTPSSS